VNRLVNALAIVGLTVAAIGAAALLGVMIAVERFAKRIGLKFDL